MTLCPENDLKILISSLETGQDPSALDGLLAKFPEDPRLVFMKGSVLAGEGDIIGAHKYLSEAVELAPDYAIARFQLGFFQLTSGESNAALKTWARLDGLPDGHHLKLFSAGLRHLIRDEFANCIDLLEQGIAQNEENVPLNGDMQLIIDQTRPLMTADAQPEPDSAVETSATANLLQQFNNDPTKH